MIFWLFLKFEKKAETKKAFQVPRETIQKHSKILKNRSKFYKEFTYTMPEVPIRFFKWCTLQVCSRTLRQSNVSRETKIFGRKKDYKIIIRMFIKQITQICILYTYGKCVRSIYNILINESNKSARKQKLLDHKANFC